MATDNALAHPFLRPTGKSRQEKVSSSVSTLLVAALHILFFFLFVISIRPFAARNRPIVETILELSAAGNNAPRQDEDNPELVNAPPRFLSAPITVLKPPPIDIIEEPAQGSATPGDILGAVGRDLACSAGSWEHLNAGERRVCGGIPWRGMKLPNGSLVMVPASQLPRLREPPPGSEFRVTGSEQMQRNLNTGQTAGQGGCPILQNTPCMHPSQGDGVGTGQ